MRSMLHNSYTDCVVINVIDNQCMVWSSSIISAVFCQDPPVADSNTCSSTASDAERDPNTQLFPYQTTIIYTCDGELKFYDGTQSKSVLCDANAEWSEHDLSCQSEYLSSIITYCYIGLRFSSQFVVELAYAMLPFVILICQN